MKFIIKTIETILVIIYIILEEVIYSSIAKPIIELIEDKKIFLRLSAFLNRSNRYFALILFLSMFIKAELLGLLSLTILPISPIMAIFIYLIKIPIGIFAFWLFKETKEVLLTFNFINISYKKIINIIDYITITKIYRSVKDRLRKLKTKKSFIKKIIRHSKIIYKKLKNQIG
jgi:hypothetical protein